VRLRNLLCGQLLFINSETLGCDRGIREIHFKDNLTLKNIMVIDFSLIKILFKNVRSGNENFFFASRNRLISH
jgi:hypothetical protein